MSNSYPIVYILFITHSRFSWPFHAKDSSTANGLRLRNKRATLAPLLDHVHVRSGHRIVMCRFVKSGIQWANSVQLTLLYTGFPTLLGPRRILENIVSDTSLLLSVTSQKFLYSNFIWACKTPLCCGVVICSKVGIAARHVIAQSS